MAATSDAMVSPNLFIPPRGHQILHYWSGHLLNSRSVSTQDLKQMYPSSLSTKNQCAKKYPRQIHFHRKSLLDLLLTLLRVRTCHKPVKEVDAEQHEKIIEELIWRNT